MDLLVPSFHWSWTVTGWLSGEPAGHHGDQTGSASQVHRDDETGADGCSD